jgi:hypothetical protein
MIASSAGAKLRQPTSASSRRPADTGTQPERITDRDVRPSRTHRRAHHPASGALPVTMRRSPNSDRDGISEKDSQSDGTFSAAASGAVTLAGTLAGWRARRQCRADWPQPGRHAGDAQHTSCSAFTDTIAVWDPCRRGAVALHDPDPWRWRRPVIG